jgi:hypothetical protein
VAGLPAIRFDGANDWLAFATRLTSIRTVFWVLRESTSSSADFHYLLGDTTAYDFTSDSSASKYIWSASWTHASIRNGQTRLNGAVVVGTSATRPTNMSILSLVTTGPVNAASFSNDRSYGRHWWGDLAELVIYDTALSDADRHAVEAYLAARYGVTLP